MNNEKILASYMENLDKLRMFGFSIAYCGE